MFRVALVIPLLAACTSPRSLPLNGPDAGSDTAVANDGPEQRFDVVPPPAPDAAADTTPDSAPVAPDVAPDVATPDSAPGCINPCLLGSSQCGPGGGVRQCVASGACNTLGPEMSCGQYVCSGSACKTTCASNVDCSLGNFCDSGACIPQCASPSSGNTVPNAGFDRTTDGFVPGTWMSEDAAGCSSSGSIYVYPTSRSDPFTITPGAHYYLGYWVKNTGVTSGTSCDFEWCSSLLCSSATVIGIQTVPAPAALGWQKVAGEATVPSNANAARITCRSGGAFIDRLFVSSAGAKF